ncbi:MAG: hypothetical protein JSV25_04845 [Spirochaetota bacterium]|nr:MAG: hypothetical protein JSV25_04845 [Spirochaetota bacterium]
MPGVDSIEKYSSAFTLSDMEIFIFPDLLYALVLANIMSPVIWEWREDSWFRNIAKKSPVQRINRLKQFIMDNFVFNLDLDTWGLTTKERELLRFKDFVDEATIAKSNALFGYEGDKYYFSIDIRKHFGLDKYEGNIIPYWKTETVEAMNAFNYKDDYDTGAGECVSLSTLYTAALYIIARISLEDIFLIATPLHSQNFININDGVLTNNRRIVTKNMWFNGTSLSTKARRALENEEVTIISHLSGHIHTVYSKATIDREVYTRFQHALSRYLKADFRSEIISNFLRKENEFQSCFQYCHIIHGKKMFIEVEKIYQYEHTSSKNFSTDSRAALLNEIDTEEFSFTQIPERIMLNDFEEFINNHPDSSVEELDSIMIEELMIEKCPRIEEMFYSLKDFLEVKPRLPETDKTFHNSSPIAVPLEYSREKIIDYITSNAEHNELLRLALYAYRDMERIDWEPYIKASVERNPVSVDAFKTKSIEETMSKIDSLANNSIYDGNRLALPDEVWNFGRGDGIEKAVLAANILKNRNPKSDIKIKIKQNDVQLSSDKIQHRFSSSKNLIADVTV